MNFPFLDGDVPRSTSYGVYISQLIRFARVSSHVDDFNTRNKVLTAKLLRQGYRYHKLLKAFSKFYRRHFDIVSKYNVGLKPLLLQGISEPEFYGDLVYRFRIRQFLCWLCCINVLLVSLLSPGFLTIFEDTFDVLPLAFSMLSSPVSPRNSRFVTIT